MRLGSKFKIAVLLGALFYAGLNADAEPENKEIVFSMNIKGYPPYLVINEHGGVDGIMMDMLRLSWFSVKWNFPLLKNAKSG